MEREEKETYPLIKRKWGRWKVGKGEYLSNKIFPYHILNETHYEVSNIYDYTNHYLPYDIVCLHHF